MAKNLIFFCGKAFLAILLLYPLASKGLLSLPNFLGIQQLALFLFSYGLLFVCNYFFSAWRFKVIIAQKGIRYSAVLFFTAIGNFFNTVLPGLVSGDFVKLYYVKKAIPGYTKKTLLFLIFFDRLAGLTGLFLLASFSLLVSFFSGNGVSMSIVLPVVMVMLGLLFFYSILFFGRSFWLQKIPYLGFLAKELNWQKLYFASFQAWGISCCIFILQMLVLYACIGFFSPVFVPILQLIPALSLGLVVVALPITPLGIGVGHIGFQFFMEQIGFAQGANLYTLFLILQALVNSPGIICYLWVKSPPKKTVPTKNLTKGV